MVSSLRFSMINTICPYFPLSTFNSITPCSSPAGSEVTLIPFLSKTSSGLDEQKQKKKMTCYLGIVSKFFQVCCFPYLTNIAPYFDNHTRNISSILILRFQ